MKRAIKSGDIPSKIKAGKIYVLRNEHMRDLIVKVGKTINTSENRAKEITNATGVVGKFQVLFEEQVIDVDYAERLVHERLSNYRLEPNREFFRLPYKIAIRAVFDVCSEVNKGVAAKVKMIRLNLGAKSRAGDLRSMLESHRGGDVMVALVYEDKKSACEIVLGDEWKIAFSPQLVTELQSWIGAQNVLVVKGE
jgi:hypothetical protein